MSNDVRTKLHQLIDTIEDESTLQIVMEDIAYYTSNKDITDELNDEQLKELDNAILEADKNQTIDWDDVKKELNEWGKR